MTDYFSQERIRELQAEIDRLKAHIVFLEKQVINLTYEEDEDDDF